MAKPEASDSSAQPMRVDTALGRELAELHARLEYLNLMVSLGVSR